VFAHSGEVSVRDATNFGASLRIFAIAYSSVSGATCGQNPAKMS
jgi:hypothetical protein